MSDQKSNSSATKIGKRALLALPVAITILSSFYTVETGKKGIVFTTGKATDVVTEGLHFKIPFVQSVKKIDIKTRQASSAATAATKDMQNVTSEISVNYHFAHSEQKLIETQKKYGFDIAETIIAPRIQEVLKAVAARYSAEQLIAKRTEAKLQIDKMLKKDLSDYNIMVEAVQLTDFQFSKEFNDAIETKQREQQKTLTAKNILERAKIEAEQKLVKSRAEAERIRIEANAIRNQGGKEYIQLKAIEKWDGKLPTVQSGNASMFINPKDFK